MSGAVKPSRLVSVHLTSQTYTSGHVGIQKGLEGPAERFITERRDGLKAVRAALTSCPGLPDGPAGPEGPISPWMNEGMKEGMDELKK